MHLVDFKMVQHIVCRSMHTEMEGLRIRTEDFDKLFAVLKEMLCDSKFLGAIADSILESADKDEDGKIGFQVLNEKEGRKEG